MACRSAASARGAEATGLTSVLCTCLLGASLRRFLTFFERTWLASVRGPQEKVAFSRVHQSSVGGSDLGLNSIAHCCPFSPR